MQEVSSLQGCGGCEEGPQHSNMNTETRASCVSGPWIKWLKKTKILNYLIFRRISHSLTLLDKVSCTVLCETCFSLRKLSDDELRWHYASA